MGEGDALVIDGDNGGQWTHREWRCWKYLKWILKSFQTIRLDQLRQLDGLILSGGAARIGFLEN